MSLSEFISAVAAKDAEIARLRQALEGITNLYCQLANSGDAGNWNPEDDPEVIQARAALALRETGE